MTWLLQRAMSLASPGGDRARLTITIFHRVLAAPDPRSPTLPDMAQFDRQLQWLKASFNVLPLHQAVKRLRDGTLPARAAAITFDDGYADNLLYAAPVLKRHGLHATFFITTGYLDGGVMWNDVLTAAVHGACSATLDATAAGLGVVDLPHDTAGRIAVEQTINTAVKHRPFDERTAVVASILHCSGVEAPTNLMLTTDQLRGLHRAGMGIGGHTVTHPILARCEPTRAWQEIDEGARQLRERLNEPIALFAYPNGRPDKDYTAEHVQMVREAGFLAAVTTSAGAADGHDDIHQLPRFTPWDRGLWTFALRMVRNLHTRHTTAAGTAISPTTAH